MMAFRVVLKDLELMNVSNVSQRLWPSRKCLCRDLCTTYYATEVVQESLVRDHTEAKRVIVGDQRRHIALVEALMQTLHGHQKLFAAVPQLGLSNLLTLNCA